MKNDIKDFKKACAFFDNIPQFSGEGTGFSCGLERARLFLDFAGHPEKDLKLIHVAGSNGKGSVCALMDTALKAAGFKTGLFTSPHLADIRERIRLSGDLIPEDDFVRILNEVLEIESRIRHKYPDFRAAYFEYLFVMSLLYFRETKTDFVILETGLGGRLDAVNACENPILCVITPVSLEHTAILGSTIEEIASEKGGIIKSGVPVVVSDNSPEALEVFKTIAAAKKSPIEVFRKKDICINVITDENIDFSLHNRYYRNVTVSLPIPAPYEAENAGLALTALAVLAENGGLETAVLGGFPKAFESFSWPGRMERIAGGVYVDGAHNTAGIKAFTEGAAAFAKGKKNVLVFAVSDDKDKAGMVSLLCESGLFGKVIVTAFSGVRSAAADEVAELFRGAFKEVARKASESLNYPYEDMIKSFEVNVEASQDVGEAIEKAMNTEHDYIFCTGSLFLAAELAGCGKF